MGTRREASRTGHALFNNVLADYIGVVSLGKSFELSTYKCFSVCVIYFNLNFKYF